MEAVETQTAFAHDNGMEWAIPENKGKSRFNQCALIAIRRSMAGMTIRRATNSIGEAAANFSINISAY